MIYRMALANVLLMAACSQALPPAEMAQSPESHEGAVAEPVDAEPAVVETDCNGIVASQIATRADGSTLMVGDQVVSPPASTVQDININGDADLELFVRHGCPRGKACEFSVYAACGNGAYVHVDAPKLVGDRLETSMKGALVGKVYWRDLMLYEFLTQGDRLGERATRYRFNGIAYQQHNEP